ncbi:MAG: putative manganese-dependent inorganic diphosphatase [Evtepia sp.]
MLNKGDIIVIGHKNPDTDSICSAIAYAELKNKISDKVHRPQRAGDLNKESKYVLDRFQVEYPPLIDDVRTQVSDIDMKKVEGIKGDISLRKAYSTMKELNTFTLAVTTEDNHLEGLITVGDIAASDMDVYDNRIVSKANTSYQNIVETLDGEVLAGEIGGFFSEGKVSIGASTPDVMEDYVSKNDLVIIGNRFESQFFAIESGISCMIVSIDTVVSPTIIKRAEARGCIIISTPYDTYTVARLLNQSMPIKFFMSSEHLLTFHMDDYTSEIKEVMAKSKHRYVPVLNDRGEYVGLVSKQSFLDMKRKQVILVDHNEKSQAVDGIAYAEILEIIDHHRLGSIETINPVFFRNQPLGCTATIISKMYEENKIEIPPNIAGLLCSAIISDTLMYRSPTCTDEDKATAEQLAQIAGLDVFELAQEMFAAASDLKERSSQDIFYQDYKRFSAAKVTFGVGQITSMNASDLDEIKPKMNEFMETKIKKSSMDMLFFMLTNIIDESTILLYKGPNAKECLESVYDMEIPEDGVLIRGMVSRKKQLIPDLIEAIQMDN